MELASAPSAQLTRRSSGPHPSASPLLVRYRPPGPAPVVAEQVHRFARALFPYDTTWLGGTLVMLSPPVRAAAEVAAVLRAAVGEGVDVCELGDAGDLLSREEARAYGLA